VLGSCPQSIKGSSTTSHKEIFLLNGQQVLLSLFTKVEGRISRWAGKKGKREKGRVGFRSRHSIIDHCITLRHFIEKYGKFRVGKSFVALLISKKLLTLFLGINFGEE